MLKNAYRTILYSLLVFSVITPNTHAKWKKVNCPNPGTELGLEAFLFATNGVRQGYSKCTKNFKFFDLDEIDTSDVSDSLNISPKDISVKVLKTSPSNVVFFEITYTNGSDKNQTMLINVLLRENNTDNESEGGACGTILATKPDNLIRKECI